MIWDFNPIAFSILGLDVRWYGLVYIGGFLLTLWLGYRLQKITLNSPFSKEQFENAIFGVFLSGILGGRLGEFLFYSPHTLLDNFWEVFKIWHGGMSIHGGLLGSLIFLIIWTRKNKIPLLSLTDILVLPLAITLVFGRIANFLNGELVGRPTGGEWGMIFPHVDNIFRHPSQLYESGKNAFLSILIAYFFMRGYWKKRGGGTVLFVGGYGILRFFIEFFREPDGMIGWLSTGQWLCLGMIFSAFLLAKKENFWHNE
ncbi:prolipoprotein diacylglyceryl transferase [Candidatus Gracilibacteria bacterium]|nr:prolipoprotein diacylglyceryl transferase [Candidatus Gracilibacteria bacterium]